MNVKFEIASRGSIRIFLGSKMLIAEGELTFQPSVFYVDSASIKNWEIPIMSLVTEVEKDLIVKAALAEEGTGTRIVFD